MIRGEEEALNALLSTHRGAITWYLSKKLTEASDIQRNQQEVRLMREVEKSKRYCRCDVVDDSLVGKPRGAAKPTPAVSRKEVEAEEKFEATLSQEQLQALEQENNSMLEGFERTLDQIK